LYERLKGMKQAIVTSQVNPQFGFALMPADWVFSQKAVVLCIESHAGFAIVQCRVHDIWARYFSSTSMELMSYTPSDCFETFAFPDRYETNELLERAGKEYYEFRAVLMIRNNEGLTKTYNRFHRPDEQSADIKRLRELHDAMDRAVLDAYGWTDLKPVCEFFPEFDEDEDDDDSGSGRAKQKKYRYRWPETIHDDVLARLLALNIERAALQAVSQEFFEEGLPDTTVKRKSKASSEPTLF
jgi:hypothetical protein